MQRIKASGVVSVMPPVQENSYDPGYFSNGNPATGELATMMTADWCNGVQEEILAVIQDAKLAPSGTDLKQLLQALKYFFSTSEAEKWRKAMVGSLVPMAVSTLPEGFGMPDGSLFLFEDYPELKEKYDAGGFNGMLLEANASAEDKAAWAGKWVKHSEGIGLYAPRLSGLFLRNSGSVGKYNIPGMPNIAGGFWDLLSSSGVSDVVYTTMGNAGGAFYVPYHSSGNDVATITTNGKKVSDKDGIGLDASRSNSEYGAQSTVMPASADMIFGLYLGRQAEI